MDAKDFFYQLDVRTGSGFVRFCTFLSLYVIIFFFVYVFLITGLPLITVFMTLTALSCLNIIVLLLLLLLLLLSSSSLLLLLLLL